MMRIARALFAAAIACTGVAAETTPAAAGPAWRMAASANPSGPPASGLVDVTCASSAMCLAIGVHREYIPEFAAERWDGIAWHVVPIETPARFEGDGPTDLGCSTSSNCYAVGSTGKNSLSRFPLMERWNGTRWSVVAAPKPKGSKTAWLTDVTCTSAKSCVAIGNFDRQFGSVPYAARWNGTAWSIVAVANRGKFSLMRLDAISCVSASRCTAVGTDYGGVGKTLVEQWNGANWSIVASANPPDPHEAELFDVSCSAAKSCLAVGRKTLSTGSPVSYVERWNGASWSLVPTPTPGGAIEESLLGGVSCAGGDNCFAVGSIFGGNDGGSWLLHWDGAKLALVDHPRTNQGIGLGGVFCSTATSCFAVGSYTVSNDFIAYSLFGVVERWNGSTWSIASHPFGASQSELRQVSCADTNFCFAVGSSIDSSRKAWTERWDGTRWSAMPIADLAGATEIVLSGVSCSSTTSCFAAGTYRTGPVSALTLVEHWDGASWSVVSGPSGINGELYSVSCPSGTVCVAVGTLTERWNGTAWTTSANPTAYFLRAVSCSSATDCFAVGDALVTHHWNGTSWSTVPVPKPAGAGTGFSAFYGVSCAPDAACFATGFAQTVKNGTPPLVERWNGSKWSITATPTLGKINLGLLGVSCTSGTSCVAVGSRSSPTGPRTLIERWNGSAWAVEVTPNPSGTQQAALKGVSCATATSCFAVGFVQSHLYNFPVIERYS